MYARHYYYYLRITSYLYFIFKDYIYFIFREWGREGERQGKKYQRVVASCTPLPGTWPATHACALTENRTGDPLLRRPTCNPLSYTSQGYLSR